MGDSKAKPEIVEVKVIEATAESFEEYGQVIKASPDGDEFGPQDAQLDLSRGIPRFYIMHIENRPLKFSTITHHASVTQCLGSVGGNVWYLGFAKPSIVDDYEVKDDTGGDNEIVQVCVFRVEGSKFLKLNRGTWHAGPLFKADTMDFYNLELSNTNVVDHTTHNFKRENGVAFLIND
ncbi:hypothetical protein RGQ29_018775 [Quercus rubra]|uniref:Ureidoglycolate hydrolase n=1 Tax=Quercus rubra TaxID=3512 RepID=A0AAN7FJS7_QUERU|nr:hypothetical protein RGQ29_018775 [Quercus rubra]